MPLDEQTLAKINDTFAEMACLSFALSGGVNATTILTSIPSANYASHNGVMARAMQVAENIRLRGDDLNFTALITELETTNEGEKSLLEKLGGGGAVMRLAQMFPVTEGVVRFRNANDETDTELVIASASTLAWIVNEKARRREITRRIDQIKEALLNPNSGMTADGALTALSDLQRVAANASVTVTVTDAQDYIEMRESITGSGSGVPNGRSTGIGGFDRETGGLIGTDFLLIGAEDKNGKSTVGIKLLDNLVKGVNGRGRSPSLMVSYEMGKKEVRWRRIAMNSNRRIPFWKLKHNALTPQEVELALSIWEDLCQYPFYFMPANQLSTNQAVFSEVERMINEHGIQNILWDYWQRSDIESASRDETILTAHSTKIANLGTKYESQGLASIVLSQLNDEGAKIRRMTGYSSNNYSYGSKQANRDCTVGMTIQLDPELFTCNCQNQKVPRDVPTTNGMMKTIQVPRWEKRPTSGGCPECGGIVVCTNPVRAGKWSADRSRSSGNGFMVPLRFTGEYFLIEEVRDEAGVTYTPPVQNNGGQRPQQNGATRITDVNILFEEDF